MNENDIPEDADQRAMEEMEAERYYVEMAILRRIAKYSLDDAPYVAVSFGLTSEFEKEQENEMGR